MGKTIVTELSIEEAYKQITALFPHEPYDHRQFLIEGYEKHPDYSAHITEDYRIRYAAFKHTVAKVLQPESILEIGVRGGVSALAFLHARNVKFLGIDNSLDTKTWNLNFEKNAEFWFNHFSYSTQILTHDSQKMESFPKFDLVHIDGGHAFEEVRHDFINAWKSGARWILCDDGTDSAVVAGIFHALKFDLDRGSVEWTYFPEAWTGNLLVRTDHRWGNK